MENKWDFQVNDIVTMKKKHPCGSDQFRILRVGPIFVWHVWDVGIR